ncbi:MAG: DUF192 domain-containing protein [Calothrix sp. SM1_5_4]|nr:DUF192 domain-containing protein [Calothrix sp. SM1_5_4]
MNKTDNRTLVPRLEVASTLWTRTKGLLGREELPEGAALWILRCNSVHTFFMNFAIDLIFINRRMVVTKTVSRVPPGRLVLPVLGASSVIELPAGFLETHPVKIGDELHVDSALP